MGFFVNFLLVRSCGLSRSKSTSESVASSVKEYIKRIRKALDMALSEAGLNLDASKVLVSEQTVGNEVVYRLKATFEWLHV
jgi:hypothetical protein